MKPNLGWSREMTLAYLAGVTDGRVNRGQNTYQYGFPNCYLQGYQHGNRQYWDRADTARAASHQAVIIDNQ